MQAGRLGGVEREEKDGLSFMRKDSGGKKEGKLQETPLASQTMRTVTSFYAAM